MKEHSDLKEHTIVPRKSEARFTGSGETYAVGKFDFMSVSSS
jgi:hypothetical protein